MSDLELLFLVLAIVYGWECACWVRRGSVGFVTWFGRRWSLKQPPALLGNQDGGVILAAPLPPLGTVLIANQFPLSISGEAALAFVSSNVNPGPRLAQTGKLVQFQDLKTAQVRGRKLVVNDEELLKAATSTFAEYLAQNLRELRDTSAKDRPQKIEQLMKSGFDTKSLKARWEEFEQGAGRVRLLTNSLFFYLFVFTPALIWRVGLGECWPGLLIGLFLFTLVTALLFHKAHKRLYPKAEDERFTHFITILLSPATAIRAVDVLSRSLLENFHPLTISKVFCSETEHRAFARKVLIELRHPALPAYPEGNEKARATQESYRALAQREVEHFLGQSKIDLAELMRRPQPADSSCLSFCPRCEAQFTTRTGVCADCGGLALVPFARENESHAKVAKNVKGK